MSAVVHAVVQATLTPSPAASPAVQAVTHVAPHASLVMAAPTQTVTDLLNKLAAVVAPYIVPIAAAIAVCVQYFLNKLPWLQSDVAKVQALYRRLLAVGIPLLGAYIASVASGNNYMDVAPWIFVGSQILFTAFQAVRAAGQTQMQAKAAPVVADGGPGVQPTVG